MAENQVIEKVGKVAGELRTVGFVAAGLHDPVDDIQTEALIAEAGLLVEKRAGLNPADVTLLADGCFQGRSDHVNALAVLGHFERNGRRLLALVRSGSNSLELLRRDCDILFLAGADDREFQVLVEAEPAEGKGSIDDAFKRLPVEGDDFVPGTQTPPGGEAARVTERTNAVFPDWAFLSGTITSLNQGRRIAATS